MKKEQEIQMLKEFSDENSTSGFEEEFVKLFSTYAKNTADITVDGMLNVYAAKKENKGNRPLFKWMLTLMQLVLLPRQFVRMD